MAKQEDVLNLLEKNPQGLTDTEICKFLGIASFPLCTLVHKGLIQYEGKPRRYSLGVQCGHNVHLGSWIVHVNLASQKELARIKSLPPLPVLYKERTGNSVYYNPSQKKRYYSKHRLQRVSYQRQYRKENYGTKEERESFKDMILKDILTKLSLISQPQTN